MNEMRSIMVDLTLYRKNTECSSAKELSCACERTEKKLSFLKYYSSQRDYQYLNDHQVLTPHLI